MVAWTDLLGRPWRLHGTGPEGMDCSTVAEEVLRRLGGDPPPASPYRLQYAKGQENAAQAFLGDFSSHYEEVGTDLSAATQEGDLVLANDRRGHPRALFVLVSAERGTFLTADHNSGVVATRRYTIRDVAGVYRLRRSAP